MPEIVAMERRIQKRPDPKKIQGQLRHCIEIAMKGERGRGWEYKISRIGEPTRGVRDDCWIYSAKVKFSTTSQRESLVTKWPKILSRLARAGCAGMLRHNPWVITDPKGYEKVAADAQQRGVDLADLKVKANEPKVLGEINLEPGDHFKDLYGLDAQLRRVMDALRLYKKTGFLKRDHCLLDGPPGCGKTSAMKCLGSMLGEEGKAWMRYDATTMTKAGVIEMLMKADDICPVLFLEEIEKCTEESLRWLLGVMDVRGEIRRTNYRVGHEARDVRMFVISSANNVKLLRQLMSGALYSRFPNKIYFPPPNRVIMRQILEREIKEINGDFNWIEPALKFGVDQWGLSDPRDLITICRNGGERLLTNEAQTDYELTMHPAERKRLERRLAKRKKLTDTHKK